MCIIFKKKVFLIGVILFICSVNAIPVFAQKLSLPQNSTQFEKETALSLLELSTGHTKKNTAAVFSEYGFTALLQKNYDRPENRIDHTSAYSIGKGSVLLNGNLTNAYLIVVRGSDGTEWLSNFDFCPSLSNETHFAGNFLSSAEDIFLDAVKVIKEKDALIIVSGHSRGGAVSNVLALMLNEKYGASRVYAYTFATPATIRNLDGLNENNIFNIINPNDLVPRVPPVQYGYRRAGRDIMLDDESSVMNAKKLDDLFTEFAKQCPDIDSYYNKELSLESLGLDAVISSGIRGITLYKVMLALGTELSKLTFTDSSNSFTQIQDLSQISSELELNSKAGLLLVEHMPDRYKTKLSRCKPEINP